VPAGVEIAHKTGSLPGLLHDAGIVFSEGGDYVIVVLTDGSAGGLIREVSGAVYRYFNLSAGARTSAR
jgi:beta-lactamase class A